MGKQSGLVRFTGKIDGLSFYVCNGVYIVRRAGGPSREQIKHGETFARVRENNREFGGASTVGKAFRVAFAMGIRNMRNPYLAPKVTQIFKQMCKLGDGEPGKRTILCSRYGNLLEGLELNPMVRFDSLFKLPLDISHDETRNSAKVSISVLKPARMIKAPAGATHFKLCLLLGAVPDFGYDDVAGKYMPLVAGFEGLHAFTDSGLLPLKNVGLSVELEAALPGLVVVPADVLVTAAVGIEFYQRVNGEDFLLESSKGMRVVRCF